VAIRDFC